MSITVNSHLGNGYFDENSFIIKDQKSGLCAIVDPCFENFSSITLPQKIEYILLTHGHVDHIAHAKAVVEKCGGKIVSHIEEKSILENPTHNLSKFSGESFIVSPDILLNDGDILNLGDSKISVLHSPGHTKGSCCYIVDNNMFTGDTIISTTIGRCDLPTGSLETMKKSIEKIKNLKENYNLYCGHGDNSTLETEYKYNPYFR